jgi:hypothetical protein
MRLLFINSLKADYVEDQLVAGLTETLGKESVSLFPVNKNYYYSRRPYPRNMGVCRNLADFVKERVSIGRQLRQFDFDAVVIGSIKRDTFLHLESIQDYLPKGIPVILIDGGDWPEIGGDAKRMQFEDLYTKLIGPLNVALVFKREYLQDKHYASNVIPFPMAFSAPRNFHKQRERYDVTCWCVESHESRTRALAILEDRYDCRANGTVRGQTFRNYKRKGNKYLEELSASRIACNFRGVGWDTLRYWEIPGVQSLMISSKPRIVIPENFTNEKHVLYCNDDLSDLTDKIDYYLKQEDERKALAQAGHQHLMQHHTYLNRAQTFIDTLSEHKNA